MKSLTQAKRDQARARAERSIKRRMGESPKRDQYNNYSASKYPFWFLVIMGFMMIVVALAAGFISGVRLYYAGRDYAALTIDVFWVTVIIGICTFLAAEVLVIVSAVSGQIYLHGKQRLLSGVPVVLGMVVAFVGNWTVTDPATTWGWVETCFPPIAVLSVAFFFEITLVPELERRQADDVAFGLARDEWENHMRDLAAHPDWIGAWATAIRDELLRFNSMVVDDLTPDEWRGYVDAEMNAEQWWNDGGIPGNAGKHSKQRRKAGGGLVDSIAGDYSKAEKVRMIFESTPILADKSVTPVNEAVEALGCGISTYYAGQRLYERNGSNSGGSDDRAARNGHDEVVSDE